MTGLSKADFSLLHSLAHVGNAAVVSITTRPKMWEGLFTTKAGVGYVAGSAFITAWILDVILIIIVICSMFFDRRSEHFQCFIDGPYGTGTREVFNTDHAVLIGSGIGVTPMASILQWVDFIWVNRDQKAFEWFLTILNQLEIEQSAHHGRLEKCIQMHLYMTAAQKKIDMEGIGLQIALELMYEKSHRDLITGLRTKTEAGRPDFNKLFKTIKAENQGIVKVFFCGAPQMGHVVKEAAQQYDFAFSKENF